MSFLIILYAFIAFAAFAACQSTPPAHPATVTASRVAPYPAPGVLAILPPQTLIAGDSAQIQFVNPLGTPYATVIINAPTLTATPTGTATATATNTPAATNTPTVNPTPTAIYFPYIVVNYPTPSAPMQLPVIQIRVFNSLGAPVNGAIVKVETCDVAGAGACASYDTATTLTTARQTVDLGAWDGIAFHTALNDYWHRVSLGVQVFSFYLDTAQMYQYVEFVQ